MVFLPFIVSGQRRLQMRLRDNRVGHLSVFGEAIIFNSLRRRDGRQALHRTPLGTLDLLVLRVLGAGPNHGYAIATRLHQLSDDVLHVEEGSLYPALYRMEEQGLIDSEWRVTENNRKAKFYKLTHKGRSAAQAELEGWLRLSGAVTRVLRELEQGA